MGDLACFYVWMGEWRLENPGVKLVVYYDPFDHRHEYSQQLPLHWIFKDIADEVWIREHPNEYVTLKGLAICDPRNKKSPRHVHIWDVWRKFMFKRSFVPKILPPEDAIARGKNWLDTFNVPPNFAVLQPLFDAGYHQYRNAPPAWWTAVAEAMIKLGVPPVILGPHKFAHRMTVPEGAYPLWQAIKSPLDSMGVIVQSQVHVGGETGLPLWSGIFRVPVVSTLRTWSSCDNGKYDYRPISYGAPVVFAQLEGDPVQVAQTIADVFFGRVITSTPIE